MYLHFYLTQRQKMAKILPKDPLASECCVWGDRNSGDAHDDVRHSHVHQVHAGVRPEKWRPTERFKLFFVVVYLLQI